MFKKILVPLDGSSLAEKILPNVAELAKGMDAQVTLLHVCYFPNVAVKESLPPQAEKAASDSEMTECAVFLGKVVTDLQSQGLKVTSQCVSGLPAREIIAYADSEKFDLIAMATHGRGQVAWVLGSTAEKVVAHATVPTLLYRVMETKVPELKETIIGMP